MAQWTADKWADYGFKSRLDEYCKHSHLLLHTGDCNLELGDARTHHS